MKCLKFGFLLILFQSKVLLEYGSVEGTNLSTYHELFCLIKEENKEEVKQIIPPVPDFLTRRSNTELCRGRLNDIEQISCSGEFILPKCICSYHQVSNRNYHNYTACPFNSKKDELFHLTCETCKKYSVNKTGPCLNGGAVICEPKMLAIHLRCSCPESFSGKYCENKIEQVPVYRICGVKPLLRLPELRTCSEEQMDECKVYINSTIFKCTTNFTSDRIYQDCDPHFKYTMTAMESGRRVINCGNIFHSTSFTIIFHAHLMFIFIYPYFYYEF